MKIINSLIKELKIEPQYIQAIPIRKGFADLTDGIIRVGYGVWDSHNWLDWSILGLTQAKPSTPFRIPGRGEPVNML